MTTGTPTHKVSLVLGGGNINDGTFNQLAFEGAAAACTASESCLLEVDRIDDSTGSYVGVEEEKFFCECEYAAMDSDLVIGVGFLHEQSIHRAAFCVPDTKFAVVDVAYGGPNGNGNNIEGIIFAEDQSGYLAGIIAGGVSVTKMVGVIGGLAIAPVKRFIQGFINGVASVCPDCTTTVIYCPFGGPEATTNLECPGQFADVQFGVEVADWFTARNYDVLFGAGGLTGSAGIKYASAPAGTSFTLAGATSVTGRVRGNSAQPYVIGVDKDEWTTTFENGAWVGASKLITSALKRVDVGTSVAVTNYLSGTALGRNFLLDASNGGVGFAEPHAASSNAPFFGPVTPTITAAANEAYSAMALGTFFTGVDANGDPVAAPPPPELVSMNHSPPPPSPPLCVQPIACTDAAYFTYGRTHGMCVTSTEEWLHLRDERPVFYVLAVIGALTVVLLVLALGRRLYRFFKRRKVNEAKLELASRDSANPAHIELAHQVATA
jgi:basic membrane protein A